MGTGSVPGMTAVTTPSSAAAPSAEPVELPLETVDSRDRDAVAAWSAVARTAFLEETLTSESLEDRLS